MGNVGPWLSVVLALVMALSGGGTCCCWRGMPRCAVVGCWWLRV